MHVSRTGSFVTGVVVTVVVGGGTAMAAGGAPVLLGVNNHARTTTGLSNTAGTPLSLTAKKGAPPLRVSNDVKVKNLDADLLDGNDASSFLSSQGTAADAAKLGGQPASAYLAAGGTAADASKLGGQPAAAYLTSAGTAADSAKLAGQPPSSYGVTVHTASIRNPETPILLHDRTAIDAMTLPAGTYAVSFNANLANTSGAGYFECQLSFAEGTQTDNGFYADVAVSGSAVVQVASSAVSPAIVVTTSFASASFSDVISLPATSAASATCYAVQGDDAHTSSVYSSNLSATLVRDVQGTPDAFTPGAMMAVAPAARR